MGIDPPIFRRCSYGVAAGLNSGETPLVILVFLLAATPPLAARKTRTFLTQFRDPKRPPCGLICWLGTVSPLSKKRAGKTQDSHLPQCIFCPQIENKKEAIDLLKKRETLT